RTPPRLIRQLLTESLVLAGVGGALGLLVGRWGQQLLPGTPGQLAPLDWRVLAFVVAITTATGIVFGTAPAVRASGTDVNSALKDSSRTVTGSRSLLRRALVVARIAVCLVFRVNPALNRYDGVKSAQLYEQIGDRLRTISGVRAVSWSNNSLMSGRRFSGSMYVQGRTYAPGQRDTTFGLGVSPTFFETM